MSTETPEQIIATAEQETAEAEQLVTALEDRVMDGDDTVTPAQIEEARGLRRFAQLRREAAAKKAAKAKQDNIDAKVLDLAAQTADELESFPIEAIAAAALEAETALAKLLDLASGREVAIRAGYQRMGGWAHQSTIADRYRADRADQVMLDGIWYRADGSQAERVVGMLLYGLTHKRDGLERLSRMVAQYDYRGEPLVYDKALAELRTVEQG